MASPMTPARLVALLDRWDIPHGYFRKDWGTHNRNSMGPWGPVNGVMMHHTGSDAQTSMPGILWNGYDGLPGPLCHGGIDEKGKVWLTGWGRVNHAGGGDPDVLKKVISENYTGILKPRYGNGSVNAVDGNARFYGFEIMYSGSHAMSLKQMETSTKVAAAICTYHKWSMKSVIGHGEWQLGKWDPGIGNGKMLDMGAYRNAVGVKIKSGPPKRPVPTKMVSYTIKKGDTPFTIARDVLRDEKRWPEIVEENPKLYNLALLPGTMIRIPEA